MIILADYNLNRQALVLSGSLVTGGWLELISIRLVTFEAMGLSADSSDRLVWNFAQTNRMLLLTANRNAKGEDSLEQVMRAENQPTSFPIITIGDLDRVNEFDYRERCVEKLVEIVIDLDDYMGAGRLFIP
ncbi:ACP S-malonyltransferase [Roseofilum capinflatum]|uniref:ACP S-malonyltransferase n=1 Tax=Roseofilum capinflatum BLCC-M114 TaxID=3022440 RepID=A0ABT7BBD1_9CYAN|nr:ACP S-malonyltransferase [Roseofilum capinflatum]MDJ1176484.1 ACP S-malonyltransferase [Roseofilum capinflatum BLCC-M114]